MGGNAIALPSHHVGSEESVLRRALEAALRRQGFDLTPTGRLMAPVASKEQVRALHVEACRTRIARARSGLERHEGRLLGYFARGDEVDPARVRPVLVRVDPQSEWELLFRYARLHWSVPVSAGYGRRVRFLVMDEANGKLIGLFGLGDPVAALGPRDAWIGWSREARLERLRHVMDAFVLGAVPPYSYLLGGKLIAMLATSAEVGVEVQRRYGGRRSWISGQRFDGRLALITTMSALGRSSLYNRLRFGSRPLFTSVGFTSGSGEFQFGNGLYDELQRYARRHCRPSAKHPSWGRGWRSRRELVRAVLPRLGLPRELVYHGIRREVFVAPLAANSAAFLRGETDSLDLYETPAVELAEAFRVRWLLPRASRDGRYRAFDPETLRLWRRSQ